MPETPRSLTNATGWEGGALVNTLPTLLPLWGLIRGTKMEGGSLVLPWLQMHAEHLHT